MLLDYESNETTQPRTGMRFCLITLVGSIGMFIAWCVGDFIYVRVSPGFDSGWLLLFFPIGVGFAGARFLRHVEYGSRVLLSIAAALLAGIGAVVLILFFGIPFHFSIGGQL